SPGYIASAQALQLKQVGERNQTLGWVGIGVGAAGLVAGAGMALWAREVQESPHVTAWVVPTGSGVQVAGVFP
ncbi:MAG: hypothetical protein L0Y66_25010, partial [Myxococcaceae bacterium]|nr:hypothetical protein [Myxococcaceae bacterium]